YARYRADSPPTGGYTGGMATIDVYSHQYIKSGEVTAAIMWVSNGKTDQLSDLNDIQAGWAVDPSSYGDNKTHFFVYWTADGYKSTGCFNLDCNGFEPVNDAPITPGDILEPENGHSKISFKIFKNKDDGDCTFFDSIRLLGMESIPTTESGSLCWRGMLCMIGSNHVEKTLFIFPPCKEIIEIPIVTAASDLIWLKGLWVCKKRIIYTDEAKWIDLLFFSLFFLVFFRYINKTRILYRARFHITTQAIVDDLWYGSEFLW
ncbi:hypothetical protein ACJX0J_028445, partial [Zea mays]